MMGSTPGGADGADVITYILCYRLVKFRVVPGGWHFAGSCYIAIGDRCCVSWVAAGLENLLRAVLPVLNCF